MNTFVNDFSAVFVKLFCVIKRVQVQRPWRQNAKLRYSLSLKEKVEGKQPKKTRAQCLESP